MTAGVAAGEPVMYGRSALLPAEATTTTPAATAFAEAKLRSSSICPYPEPRDMLMMSTASSIAPSPFGSSAKSMPRSSASPLQEVATALQTLTAIRLAPGATPPSPAMMSATCVPWPWSSIGSGSSERAAFGHAPPTKS